MAATLPRPGVEVLQEFRTVSPTVVTPTLPPCIVGVCKQLVELYTQSATGANQLNSGALAFVPAFLIAAPATGSPPVYTGLDGLSLVLSVNNGPDVTITFEDAAGLGLSPASVAAQVTAALAAEKVTELVAGYDKNTNALHLMTVAPGDSQSIEVRPGTSEALLSLFGGPDPGAAGWAIGNTSVGKSGYSGQEYYLPVFSLPDPKGNLSELVIEPATVRVFLSAGGSASNVRELSRSEAHLRCGQGVAAAVLTGTVALAEGMYGQGGTLDGATLMVRLDGAAAVTVTFTAGAAAPADAEDVVQQINTALGKYVASVHDSGSGTFLRLTSTTKGTTSSVEVTGGTAQLVFGLSSPSKAVGTSAVVAVDDGDGDSQTPLVDFAGEDFTAAPAAASVQGIKDVSAALASLKDKDLTLSVDGRPQQTMVLGDYAQLSDFQDAVERFFGTTVLSVSGLTTQTFASLSTGEQSALTFVAGSALPVLGLVPYAQARVSADAWRLAGTAAVADYDAVAGKKLRVKVSGTTVEHTFGAGPFANFAAVVADLNANAAFAAVAEASDDGNEKLRIAAKTGGKDAYVQVLQATADEAAYLFGWNAGEVFQNYTHYGKGYAPVSGDDVYVDGVLLGRVLKVAPGGVVSRIKLAKEVTVGLSGDYFRMVAKNLPRAVGPDPELVVDAYGNVTVSPFVLRDVLGAPMMGVSSAVYATYRALRLDVTPVAAQPGLLRFDSTAQLEDTIAPISVDNPLALGVYFALLNAPSIQVTALGVDEVSEDAPFGTVEAFTRAAEFLESYEVYALAPLTHDATAGQVFDTHVTAMSEPSNKGERIVLFNWSAPTRAADTLIASGEGNNSGAGSAQFDTGVVNLGALLLANKVSPVGTIPASAGVFLDLYSDDKHYSVESVVGGVVNIRTVFGPGENDDSFYATTLPSTLLVDELFAVRVRGAELKTPAGLPDKNKTAETYQAMGQGMKNRRFWSIMPDKCAATVGGVEQVLEGFYMCAAVAGMIGQQPPQQSFTNFPMTGFTRVIGSNDYFSTKQLDVIAAGGNYIVVQDAAGVPLIARQALTTDLTSVETRTDSIVKVVDYTAKFLRGGLKNFIGRYNITNSFIDTISHVTQGLLGFLEESGVLIGASLNNVIQDENNPDTLLIDVTLDVPYPCNYIRLTLVI